MKKQKMLTLEQLAKFFDERNIQKFDSNKTGHRLYVQVEDFIEFSDNDEDKDFMHEGLEFYPVRTCHTLLNRNNSYISEKDMRKALPSLAYRPFLGAIHQLDDGSYDFHQHDMNLVENEDGEYEYEYIETQIGAFTVDKPKLVYDKDKDKTYVEAIVAIPTEYSKAAEIIKRKGGTKVSCELAIDKMSYDAENKWLVIEDFIFSGVTALGSEKDGTEIQEGMEGSRLNIDDFASSAVTYSRDEELIEALEKLNNTLSNFNIDNYTQKGGLTMTKFEELLEKYEKSVEDIDFEYEDLSDDELETKFAEVFGEKVEEPETEEPETEEFAEEDPDAAEDSEGTDDGEEDDVIDDDETPESKKIVPESYSIKMSDGTVKEFALSLQDQISALYTLVNDTYAEADGCWYDVIVYDKNLVMSDWWSGRSFRQDYKVRTGVYSLVGDRVPVHSIFVTEDEEKALDELKANFAAVSEELNKYHEAETKAEKETLMSSDSYKSIFEKDEFKEINIDEFTVETLTAHLDEILLKYAKEGSLNFAQVETEDSKPASKKLFGIPSEKPKKGKYGKLFNKKK